MNKKRNINNNIIFVFKLFAFLCFLLFINIVYLQVFDAKNLMENPHNSQVLEKGENILRGNILTKDGTIIAYSEKQHTQNIRIYPQDKVYSPMVGYFSSRYGSDGIEATENLYLSGNNKNLNLLGPLGKLFTNDYGYNVRLTINETYQNAAYNSFNQKGAIILLDAKNGEILAMVSKPSYNPNTINKEWDTIVNSPNALLLNRVTSGIYPPGSTIKPLIAAGALNYNLINKDTLLDGNSNWQIGPDYILNNDEKANFGMISLNKAMAVSSNTYFGRLALLLGAKKLENTFDTFGFDKKLATDFPNTLPKMPDFSELSKGEIVQMGIGQGSLLVTPLRMSMLASAFVNNGTIMKPYIVDQIEDRNGNIKEKNSPEVFIKTVSSDIINTVADSMEEVVTYGTGKRAKTKGVKIIGKTGTAENTSGKDHAWFMGAFHINNRAIAFAIIVEEGGFGGAVAAPIIHNIINQILAKEGD